MANFEDRLLELAGRLHMLLVHFPIGLILAAGFVELVGRGRSKPGARATARWCLGLGAAGAVLAAVTGWIHADAVPIARSSSWILLQHRCGGIATALVASLTWVLGRPAGRQEAEGNAYRVGLLVSCCLVAATGHWGGTLVHGRNYLFEPLFREQAPPEPGPTAAGDAPAGDASDTGAGLDGSVLAFAAEVEPILAARCYGCHGEERQKGRLRLDRLAELLERPGQTVIVPGDPDASELVARVELPADDLDVMPAKGEPLTPAQIHVLRRWIADGASLPTTSPHAPSGASPATSSGEPPASGEGT